MKLTTVRHQNSTYVARLHEDVLTLLNYSDLGELLQRNLWYQEAAEAQGVVLPLSDAELAPIVSNPGKIICVGANYLMHVREMSSELPEYPTLFAKFSESLVGPHDAIELPREDPDVDWEAELTVVIGKEGRRIEASQAAEYIAGYTVANDISMRGYQFRSMQWLQGKTWENSTPIGPFMVTPDELSANARIQTRINGAVMQDSTIDDLLFKVNDLIAYISTIVTLKPGDVILTGTPSGVGAGRDPKVYIKPGDVLETEIEGIGVMRNTAVRA